MLMEIMVGDAINDAFQGGLILGLILGFAGVVLFFVLYWSMMRASLKRYLLQADEGTRVDVMEEIRSIRDTADAMAVKTNTVFFKNLANQLHSLVAFIKKRNLG